MRINHNIAALNTYRQLSNNGINTSKALEKLSSGLRINRAGDDAAGLAISEKMRGQIRGLDQASRNAQDGISLIQTAEGALNETHSILQRMRELAVQSANDTNTSNDRAEIQKEVDQLAVEITRISNNTEFNTQKLLNGGITSAGIGENTFHIGANSNQNINISISAMDAKTLGVSRDVQTVTGTGAGIVSAASFGTILGAGNKTDGAVLTFNYSAAAAATNAQVDGLAALAGADLSAINADTKLVINVDGTDYTVGNATLKTITAGTTDAALVAIINAAQDAGGNALSTVATASDNGGNLRIISASAGSSSSITIDYQGSSVAAVSAVFGAADGLTDTGSAATSAKVTVSDGSVSQDVSITDTAATTFSVSDGRYQGISITLTAGNNVTGLDNVNDKVTLDVATTNATAASFSAGAKVDDAVTAAGIDVSTKTSANSAITVIEAAITTVSAERSKLGAYQNRLEHTINNLGTSSENLTASESRIRDVDMAKEMMEFTKNNILSQAAQAMLAQANQQPQGVLQLLR